MGGTVLFSVCLSVHTRGGGGGYPSSPDRGALPPNPYAGGGGVTTARSLWGTPSSPVGQEWGTSPIGTGWGYPQSCQYWMEDPPPLLVGTGWGTPPREIEQHSDFLLRTGGMPLVFTQEDFLVYLVCRIRQVEL